MVSKLTVDNAKGIVVTISGKPGSLYYSGDLEKMERVFMYLNMELFGSGVQILIVGGIEAYQEYYPLTIINDSKEFVKRALQLTETFSI